MSWVRSIGLDDMKANALALAKAATALDMPLVLTSSLEDRSGGLNPLRLPAILLRALASDFYSPRKSATLHAEVFPSEFFNPQSSPRRIQELIRRLRRELTARDIPLSVTTFEGFYGAEPTSACGIRTRVNASLGPGEGAFLDRLGAEFGTREFSASEVAGSFDISVRTANRLLRSSIQEQKLSRSGSARATRFRFPPIS